MGKALRMIQGCAVTVAAGLLLAMPVAAQSVLDEWATVKAPPPPAIKPVTLDPKKSVYMVLDFRLEACTMETRPRCAKSLPHVEKLLKDARAKGMLVVHTLTTNSKVESIPAVLKPLPGEQVIAVAMDKMSAPGLADSFKAKGIDTVLISGTSGNNAVMNTAVGAVLRGFKAIVPVDTMPSEGAFQEQFAVWQIGNGSTLREEATLTRSDMVTIK
jgi:nicotinamidase-related amidase